MKWRRILILPQPPVRPDDDEAAEVVRLLGLTPGSRVPKPLDDLQGYIRRWGGTLIRTTDGFGYWKDPAECYELHAPDESIAAIRVDIEHCGYEVEHEEVVEDDAAAFGASKLAGDA